jgi:hypothetical protein
MRRAFATRRPMGETSVAAYRFRFTPVLAPFAIASRDIGNFCQIARSIRKDFSLWHLGAMTALLLQQPWARMASRRGDVGWFCFWPGNEEDRDPNRVGPYLR